MRDLIVTENVTLDGVADGLGEWFTPDGGDDQLEVNRRHSEACDAVLLGRLTYEEFAGYWPQQTDDTTGVTDYLNRTQKYVVSATLERPDWRNTTVLGGGAVEAVAGLKDRPGKDIVLAGSLSLAETLLGAGLVDEVRLFVHPLVRGAGRRVWPGDWSCPLELAETRAFASGVVLLTYRVSSRTSRSA